MHIISGTTVQKAQGCMASRLQLVPALVTFVHTVIDRRADEAALKQAESASDAVRAHYAGCMVKVLLLCVHKAGVTSARTQAGSTNRSGSRCHTVITI